MLSAVTWAGETKSQRDDVTD